MNRLLVLFMIFCLLTPSFTALGEAALPATDPEDTTMQEAEAQDEPIEELGDFVVGATTRLSGTFFTNMWGNNTCDIDVRSMIHGYSPVAWMTQPSFYPDPYVVLNLTQSMSDNGNKLYIISLLDDLLYSDGSKITARDYALSFLLHGAPQIAEIGGTTTNIGYIEGYEAFNSGETNVLAGVRVFDDLTFGVEIKAEYLPFFYELSMIDAVPYPISVIAPGCEVADDGNGVYIRNIDQSNPEPLFTADLLRRTILDPDTGYLSHPSVTSGPYMLTDFDWDTRIARFKINPYYKCNWEGYSPTIDDVVFKQVLPETMIKELIDGDVQLLNKVVAGDNIIEGLNAYWDNGETLGNDSADAENADATTPDVEDADATPPDAENADATTPDAEDADATTPDAEDTDATLPDAEDGDAMDPDTQELDVASDPSDEVSSFFDTAGISMGRENYLRMGMGFLSFSCEQGPTQFESVRKAIAYTVDTSAFVTEYNGYYGGPVYGYYGLGQWMVGIAMGNTSEIEVETDEELAEWEQFAADYAALNTYDIDQDTAKQLLIDDGWTLNEKGEPFTEGIDAVRYKLVDDELMGLNLKWGKMMDSFAADSLEGYLVEPLAQIGIAVEVIDVPFAELLAHYYRQRDRTFDMMYLATNFINIFDPYFVFNTADEYQGHQNTTGFRDEELERLALDLRQTEPADLLAYCKKWIKFQEYFNEKLPMLPLYSNMYFDFYTPMLRDYYPNAEQSWPVALVPAVYGAIPEEETPPDDDLILVGEDGEAQEGDIVEF